MVIKTKIAGLAVVLMALSAPTVWADNGGNFVGGGDSSHKVCDLHHGKAWHHGQNHHMMSKVLNLTEDQQKQLKDIKQKQRETMKGFFEQIKSNREELNAEIIKATPDMSKVNNIQAQMKTLQSQMVDNHLNSILEIKKIMTPEQFAGYMTLKKERKLMKHMMGHGKFGHKGEFGKDGACKLGEGHEHWGDKADKDHGPEDQD